MSQLPEHKNDVFAGWGPLLDELHQELITIRPNYEVAQVKEKWGLLRVYIEGTPIQVDATGPQGLLHFSIDDTATDDNWEEVQTIIDRYEEKSGTICEYCGGEGELNQAGYWWKTMCPSCEVDQDKRNKALHEAWNKRHNTSVSDTIPDTPPDN